MNKDIAQEWLKLVPEEPTPAAPGPSEAAASVNAERELRGWARVRWKMNSWITNTRSFLKSRAERNSLAGSPTQKNELGEQRRNTLLLVAATVIVLGSAVWFANQYTTSGRVRSSPSQVVNAYNVAPSNADKESFRAQYAERVSGIEGDMANLKATIAEQQKRLKALQEKGSKKEPSATPRRAAGAAPIAPPTYSEGAMNFSPAAAAASAPMIARVQFGVPAAPSTPPAVTTAAAVKPPPPEKPQPPYIPSGSFAQTVLLTGVSAPTGANAMADPVPVLMEVVDLAQLPNEYRNHLERCFLTGNAVGDLSSERVWVRLERLSCQVNRETVLDLPVRGYAVGEDGKTGIRAQLVERSGQAIANAILLGTLSGLGKAVSISAQDSFTYSSGASSTRVRDPWRAGVGQGASSALDRIADYYLKMLDHVFPVLEIGGGRTIDIVFSQGFALTPTSGSLQALPAATVNSAEVFGHKLQRQRSTP